MRYFRGGFTLIEILVVIAIIGVLAALLFPLYGVAREKVHETKCASNQRQLVQAIHIWAQDHSEVFPPASDFWQNINLDNNVYKCPSDKKSPYGYIYNNYVAGKSFSVMKDVESTTMLTADGAHEPTNSRNGVSATFLNIGYEAADLAFRHGGDIVLGFADGHAVSTKDRRDLPIEFCNAPAAEFDGFDAITKGSWWAPPAKFRFGTQGYALCNWDGSNNIVTNLNDPATTTYIGSVTQTGLSGIMWAPGPGGAGDARALANPQGGQAAACWSGNGTISIKLKTSGDTTIHTVHIYCVDWDYASRSMKLDFLDPTAPINPPANTPPASLLTKPVTVNFFGDGTWATFRFRGNININLLGKNAVVSGLVFD